MRDIRLVDVGDPATSVAWMATVAIDGTTIPVATIVLERDGYLTEILLQKPIPVVPEPAITDELVRSLADAAAQAIAD